MVRQNADMRLNSAIISKNSVISSSNMESKNIENMKQQIELSYLRHALESTRSAIIITDANQPDDPIIYINPAFEELTGYTEEDVIGKNCRFLQGEKTDKKSIDLLRDAIKKKESIRIELLNYKKNGTPFWNDLIMSPVKDDSGKVTHFVGLQLDITQKKEAEEELRNSQEQLARSNQELQQFAYVASHDLQEPLRMIISYLGLIESKYKDQLDDKAHKYINYAVDGGKRMQALINDLLTFSRVKSKANPYEEVDMNDILKDVLFNLKLTIKEHKAKITSSNLPIVLADPLQMIQLVQNFVTNGIKYQPKGRIPKIEINVKKSNGMWEFSFKDNGIGIEDQYYERIFNIFQRLHTREEYPGTGMGLAIVKRIVERHNGKVWLESMFGKGTTFYFTLPIDRKQSDDGR
jgi:PAS domain S-box-containing protein